MIKYSFVLPAYKARFFKEAIDSILAQTYTDFELIIVNDASPEDLDAIVGCYDDPRIQYYVNEENIGGKDLVAQWNHCLEYAQGEYVILASDDDVYFPQYLEKMDTLVCKYPDVNVFRPRVQRINEKGEILEIESFIREYNSMLEFSYAWMQGYVKSGIPFYVFKKASLLEIGGFINFPLAWYSDDATVLKLADKGIVASSEILFSFRHSGESITTKANDAITLQKKLDATDLFFDWYRSFLSACVFTDDNDVMLQEQIAELLPVRMKDDTIGWLYCSNPTAIIKNSHRLVTYNGLSHRLLLKIISHRLYDFYYRSSI